MTIDDFKKMDLRVGRVAKAERVEGSEKLIKLQVDLGETDAENALEKRQIVAGIGLAYEPESLVGMEILVVANLEPRSIMGIESRGMLLAASGEDGRPVILTPEKAVSPGTEVG